MNLYGEHHCWRRFRRRSLSTIVLFLPGYSPSFHRRVFSSGRSNLDHLVENQRPLQSNDRLLICLPCFLFELCLN
ncbi:hypothetical protein M6B38_193240 [Iris pallida]|uniref:Uncharacterized protein n=1 Tax=Iris pallida TaxID=29817 RepID=A0AAX6EE71_IRIPA|nr:hypothetical protein M6B38_193240 [Iris pallida]